MPILDVQNVSLAFGSTQALVNANLTIEAGEVVALMGANGAGKSTLVKILSGLYRPDAGNILWQGEAFAPKTPAEAATRGIVTVHQSTDVVGVPGLTVADALLLNHFVDGRHPFFLSRTSIRKAAAHILSDAGFDLPLDRDFEDLSAADRQLLAIARALANKARLLILDEPTASLSSRESLRLYDLVRGLRQRGISVLYISHRTADLAALADRVEILRGGRNVGSFRQPIDFDPAIETMIGRSLKSARPDRRERFGRTVLEIENARLLPDAKPFSLSLREGEVVAITGVLGAGKSRLLSSLFGLGAFADGTVTLDSKPYSPRSPADAISSGVAMAAEDRHRSSFIHADWPGESIAASISLPHLKTWYPSGFLFSNRELKEGDDAIQRLAIKASSASASVWSLSGGNQQKTVIARWEAEPSRLLLLDEPFQGVDVGARQDIIATIRRHADRATLIATSDREEAFEVADRVLVMEHHTLLESPLDADATQPDKEFA
ncbi:sugar ABC transporter ATP-binding protein [Agrobacterium sp. rho-8.1]|nr:sugar ABC transporter ATP-binding protein [Agrobacterium sp. rho-8.1]